MLNGCQLRHSVVFRVTPAFRFLHLPAKPRRAVLLRSLSLLPHFISPLAVPLCGSAFHLPLAGNKPQLASSRVRLARANPARPRATGHRMHCEPSHRRPAIEGAPRLGVRCFRDYCAIDVRSEVARFWLRRANGVCAPSPARLIAVCHADALKNSAIGYAAALYPRLLRVRCRRPTQ